MFGWGRPPASNNSSGSSGSNHGPTVVQARPLSQPYTRTEHLQSYLTDATLKPSTRRVSGDDTTYDTVFQTKKGHALILRVHLPIATASQSRPAMTLVGVKATHLWLDRKMRIVGFSPIANDESWAQSNMTLGDAVNRVVKHLQLKPPDVIEITDESLKRLQASLSPMQPVDVRRRETHPSHPPVNTDSMNNGVFVPDHYASTLQTSQPTPVNFPAVPRSFPELDIMSKDEMRVLLDDDVAFKAYMNQMDTVDTVNDLYQSIFKGNVETAESHMSKKEELESLHAECEVLRVEARDKLTAFQVVETKVHEICQPTDVHTAIRELRRGKKILFDKSEDLASQWINGEKEEMGVDEFVKEFMEIRTLHHQRAAKIERLEQM